MKMVSLIMLCIIYVASGFNMAHGQDAVADFKKLDWIEGTWKRTDTKEGQNGYERWVRLAGSEWQGFGLTMQGNDTSFVEKLRLIIKNKHIYYIADVSGKPEPVWYRFTEISENGFICENTEYDFPKRIEYRKKGNKIKATVSGDGKFVDYLFKRQKE